MLKLVRVHLPVLVVLFVACNTTQPVEGNLFISAVSSPNQVIDALAVDFVPSKGDLTQSNVFLTIAPVGTTFVYEAVPGSPDCVQLPQSGRLLLVAAAGQVTLDARVSITAHRDTCDGAPLDNAVWPTTAAAPPHVDAGVDASPTTDGGVDASADSSGASDAAADGG